MDAWPQLPLQSPQRSRPVVAEFTESESGKQRVADDHQPVCDAHRRALAERIEACRSRPQPPCPEPPSPPSARRALAGAEPKPGIAPGSGAETTLATAPGSASGAERPAPAAAV